MYSAIVFLAAIFITALSLLLFWKRSDRAFGIFLKTLTFVFCGVGFFRFMLSDSFIYVTQNLRFHTDKIQGFQERFAHKDILLLHPLHLKA